MARPALAPRLFTALALVGFAANSLLCRAALGARTIDAASFTALRIASGALVLGLLAQRRSTAAPRTRDLRGALALFAYALCFSLAYLRLPTGMGALLLFGAVQATMIGIGLFTGERPSRAEWLGLLLALGGLVTLLKRGLGAPDPVGAALMLVAGAAWGIYSILGRGGLATGSALPRFRSLRSPRSVVGAPLAITAHNFARALPLALLMPAAAALLAPHFPSLSLRLQPGGILLAVASGALASGVGYALWYAALPSLTALQAAVVQLAAPLLAAVAGVVVLGEQPTLRLALAALAIGAGVTLAVAARRR